MQGLLEGCSPRMGLPCSLYTDRGSHYFTTPKAGGAVDRRAVTQSAGHWRKLGNRPHRPPIRPRRAGRSERAFPNFCRIGCRRNWHWRASPIWRRPNAYLRETYVAQHNARFAVAAEQSGSAFVPAAGIDLHEVLCHQEERQVGNDTPVMFQRLRLQIPASPLRAHYVRATVKVRRYQGRAATRCFTARAASGANDGAGLHARTQWKQAA